MEVGVPLSQSRVLLLGTHAGVCQNLWFWAQLCHFLGDHPQVLSEPRVLFFKIGKTISWQGGDSVKAGAA